MVIVVSYVATLLISQVTDLSLTTEIRTRMDSNFVYILIAIPLGVCHHMCPLQKYL
jgi:hypothetical protein